MPITKIRTVPTSLPRARLYLDDIVEIQTIITDVMRVPALPPNLQSDQEKTPELIFDYFLDESLQISTMEELIAQGGYAKDFSLQATWTGDYGGRCCSLHIRPKWASLHVSQVSFHGLNDKGFELHARISKVFEDRQLPLRALLDKLSLLSSFAFPLATFGLGYFVVGLFFGFPHHRTSITLGSGCVALASLAVLYFDQKNSRVYLTPHRQDIQAKKERTKERVEKFLWLVAGAILGSVVTIISGHFKK